MYRHLLVPVDGTELSDRAIDHSVGLARHLGAAITGFVVEPPPPLPSVGVAPDDHGAAASVHELRAREHARVVLRHFEKRAAEAGVAFSGHYAHSHNVDMAIDDAAREHGCDLIVMATHGRGAFGELLFGSHTKAVLARSKLPLLILR